MHSTSTTLEPAIYVSLPGRLFHWLQTVPLLLLLAAGSVAHAQVPTWTGAVTGSNSQLGGTCETQAVATDAAGNVFVTGVFSGSVAFGSTTLISAGTTDLFVAKYVPGTSTWAWAHSGGGSGNDQGNGIAVSGSNVYVTGSITNNTTNSNAVVFGTTTAVSGASSTLSQDLVVAKYTDNGSSATLAWAQVGGGTGPDQGNGIAVSGSTIYVTGFISNNTANSNAVVFGGSGPTAVNGASSTLSQDLVVAKYTDNGSSATLGWTQVGGGTGPDQGNGIAVNGSTIYVTGALTNTAANSNAVVFGGGGTTAGTTVVSGVSSISRTDLVVAKYLDGGSSATLAWTQVGGGFGADQGNGIAVSGSSVYVTGSVVNNLTNSGSVVFGSGGTTVLNGASRTYSPDLVVVKYLDNGPSATLSWTQVGGGVDSDQGSGIAVSGSSVYVTGFINTSTAAGGAVTFGGSGTTAGTTVVSGAVVPSQDVVLAKYLDNGPSATLSWTQVGGGTTNDTGTSIAVSGPAVFVGGSVGGGDAFSFGPVSASTLLGTSDRRALLGQLDAGSSAWQALAFPATGGTSETRAVATDAAGNVFVTGFFSGSVTFGTTTLNSAGYTDLFVAKYVPSTNTWAWAARGGGLSFDQGSGIAVSGSNVYVTGYINNNTTNGSGVGFGGSGPAATAVNGATSTLSQDLVVAKYLDNGSSATLVWAQVGGGTGTDQGNGIAASGGNVYVTGLISNSPANSNRVVFGGNGTTAGTTTVNGAGGSNDLLVVKYLDNGSSATLGWTQVGGGTATDQGNGIAVSGSSVYVTGCILNTLANTYGVVFGGNGTTPGTATVNGASSGLTTDLVVAKYTDNGSSATLGWTQVGGGNYPDQGNGIAVNGSNVYVTGYFYNDKINSNAVVFGGGGTTAGSTTVNGASNGLTSDLLVAKYLDNGSSATLGWTQVGGGSSADQGLGIAVSGTSVYVTGSIVNTSANGTAVVFGGGGTTAGTVTVSGIGSTVDSDLVVAKYTDNGSSATLGWTKVGGGNSSDIGFGVAVSGQTVLAAGSGIPVGTFGSISLAPFTRSTTTILGRIALDGPLATQVAALATTAVWPNPIRGGATLNGLALGSQVQLLDILGRVMATVQVSQTGTATVPAGLAPGMYVVRSGANSQRLAVE